MNNGDKDSWGDEEKGRGPCEAAPWMKESMERASTPQDAEDRFLKRTSGPPRGTLVTRNSSERSIGPT